MTRDWSHLRRLQPVTVSKATVSQQQMADLIDQMAADQEPEIVQAFIDAAAVMGDRIDVEALATAIQTGNLADMNSLAIGEQDQAYAGVWPPIQDLMDAAASKVSLDLLAVRYDLANPYTEAFLTAYRGTLIKQLSSEVTDAIHEVVAWHVQRGIGPAETARAIKQVVGFGLTKQQARAMLNYRDELESLSPDAIGAATRLLRDHRFDATVEAAINSQTPLTAKQVASMVDAYQRRMSTFRATMIARTESIRAANAGSNNAIWSAINRGIIEDQGAVTKHWMISKDERTCAECKAIARINAKGVGMDEPFLTPLGTVMLPPAHPNCRCTVWHKLDVPEPD